MSVNHYALTVADGRFKNIARDPQNCIYSRKFGRCESVGSGAFEAIWSVGGTYPWQSSAQELFVASSDGGDAGDVIVWGIDANNVKSSVQATIAGQSAVSLGSTFVNLERARAVGTFTGNINAGFGAFTAGVPATQLLQIVAGDGSTKMALTTVPSGHLAGVSSFRATAEKAADVKLRVRIPDYSWWDIVDEHMNDAGAIEEEFPVPSFGPGTGPDGTVLVYPAGSQFEVIGQASVSNGIMTATVGIIYVEAP